MGIWVRAALVSLAALIPLDAGARVATRECIPADQCCKICDAGRACGKTCISAAKTCHKGRGCACDAGEVCAR